jgi:hypothetical protein
LSAAAKPLYADKSRPSLTERDNTVKDRRVKVVLAAAAGLILSPAAAAGKADSVDRLVFDGKHEAAQTRCERWEAWDSREEHDVREACAKAFWPIADARDTRDAWADFRTRWTGTETSARARSREAAAALRELPGDADEDLLMDLRGVYAGTPSAEDFEERAAAAALRDARTAREALDVARRWPDHPDLAQLVARYPSAFLTVDVDGRRATWSVDPPVALTGVDAVKVRWVARKPSGETRAWDRAAKDLLVAWGVPDATVAALPEGDNDPLLPVCWVPGQPAGWRAGVELSVGDGRLFHPIGWDDGCGPEPFPVFLSLRSGRVVGISLRPGHRLDLTETVSDGRRNTRAWMSSPPGTPMLWNGWVHERVGAAWLVTPLSGGQPWATLSAPPNTAVPLTSALRSAALPGDWTVDGKASPPRVTGAALAGMPPALQTWTLVPGELRSPPPLVREVIGLTSDRARPARPPAPPLGDTGWVRTGSGAVARSPPSGGAIAGMYKMEDDDVAKALQAAEAVGMPRARMQVIDGWRGDLDRDGITERVLRCDIDGAGALLIVDPLREAFDDPGQARVFLFDAPRVRADARPADTPFTFRKGDFVYLAWGGQEVLGPQARRSFVEVVRSDGAGFTLDDVELP